VILYLDTSALVKLYVAEAASDLVRREVRACNQAATSRVAYPEARAALARRQRERALSGPGLRRAATALDRDLDAMVIVELRPALARMAGELAEHHGLRGFDAIHLASALELERLVAGPLRFISFDDRQSTAAAAIGLDVVAV